MANSAVLPQPRSAVRLVAAAAALLALALAALPAQANGNPLTITLSYLDSVSNWGPTGAAGVAEMVGKEGELRLVANGLPELENETYEVWILNTNRGDRDWRRWPLRFLERL